MIGEALATPALIGRPLVVEGTHAAMGEQQGAALTREVSGAEAVLLGSEAFQLLRPRFVPDSAFAWIARRRARSLLAPVVGRHRPNQLERMLGIARGAGRRPSSLWFLHAAELLLASCEHEPAPPLAACSTVGVSGPTSVLHKNFDYPAFVQPFLCVRESRPARGYRYLDLSAAPLAGTLDGLNERGLAITYNYGFVTDVASDGVPISLSINAALERCATIAEAVELISREPRGGGALLMLGDASGAVAALELSPTRSAVRPAAPGSALCHTNSYSAPALQDVEVPPDAIYSRRNVRALRGVPVHVSSRMRLERLERLLAGPGQRLDLESLHHLFSDHGTSGVGDDDTVCRHGPYWSTTAVVQLVPRERRMRVGFGPACRARLADFAL